MCIIVWTIFCIPTVQTHWNKQLNITPEQWKKIYTLPYLTTKDTYLRWLQYRILHNILPTNWYLVKIQVCESNKCLNCKNDKETIDFLFWHCDVIQLFIEQLKPLLSTYIFHPTKQTLLLGDIDDMEMNLLYLEVLSIIVKEKLFLYQWVTL